MSAAGAVDAEGRNALADLAYRMIVAAARKDEAAPTHVAIVAAARQRGLAATDNAVRLAMKDLVRCGRVALLGATCHMGYSLPGTELRTQSSCQPAGFRRLGVERTALRCPTLEERAAMFAGQRYEDVPHREGPVMRGNPYLEAHGWASPLAGE